MRDAPLRWSLLLLLPLGACSGAIDGDMGQDTPGSTEPPSTPGSPKPVPGTGGADPWTTPGGAPAPAAEPSAGPVPLRRLSRVEYNHTLRDLLGAEGEPANDFATDVEGASGFAEGGPISGGELDRMYDVMDRVARAAVASRWAQLVPCDPARGEDACADQFIKVTGRRLYRHALSAEEAADLKAIYADARRSFGQDFKGAARAVLTAMLMSPRFHYHWTLGDRLPRVTRGLVALDPWELASRLSNFVWQSAPDDALLDAAERGELARPDGVLAQARRLLADPTRGPRAARGFVRAWLELEELPARDMTSPADPKTYGPGLHAAMLAETMAFMDDLVGGQDRKFQTLLGATYGFVNAGLAKVYGVSGVSGTKLERVALDPAQRRGILTQAAFLASSSSTDLATPIRRGRFLYERLATCRAVPAPEGAIPEPPPAPAGTPVREQLARHGAEGACKACHQFMDPIGFAFLSYDQLGRFRATDEKGRRFDTTGSIPGVGGAGLAFDGAVDLAAKLSTAAEAQRCFSRQIFRYALRKAIAGADEPSAEALADLFGKSGHDVRELMLAATQVFSFYHRAPSKGEVLP